MVYGLISDKLTDFIKRKFTSMKFIRTSFDSALLNVAGLGSLDWNIDFGANFLVG